jgi:hypothetical protein
MITTSNTPNGIHPSNGQLFYDNTLIHNLPGFLGICSGVWDISGKLSNEVPQEVPIDSEIASQIDNAISIGISDLDIDSDYERYGSGWRLKDNRILQTYYVFQDQFTDQLDIFSKFYTPFIQDINQVLAQPDQLRNSEEYPKIVESFDASLNIVSYVPNYKLTMIIRYSTYDKLSGYKIRVNINTLSYPSIIEIPKSENEIHKIDYVLLKYVR